MDEYRSFRSVNARHLADHAGPIHDFRKLTGWDGPLDSDDFCSVDLPGLGWTFASYDANADQPDKFYTPEGGWQDIPGGCEFEWEDDFDDPH